MSNSMVVEWLQKLENYLITYTYDLRTPPNPSEMNIYKSIQGLDFSEYERITEFFNYIHATLDIPERLVGPTTPLDIRSIKEISPTKKPGALSIPSGQSGSGVTPSKKNRRNSALKTGGDKEDIFQPGSLVSVMSIAEGNDCLIIRPGGASDTRAFLHSLIKIHAAHIYAPELHCLPTINSVVVTTYKEDDIWYRAKILRPLNEEYVIVRYIDFGVIEKALRSKLRQYNYMSCTAIPMIRKNYVKLQRVPQWNLPIKQFLLNISKNFYNSFELLYNNVPGEPIILQNTNSPTSLNDDVLRFEMEYQEATRSDFITGDRGRLLPKNEITLLLKSYNLPSVSHLYLQEHMY